MSVEEKATEQKVPSFIKPLSVSLRPNIERSDPVRPLINVGARLDIISGSPVTGRYGETLINGGLPALTGVVGMGNSFKTTFERYLMLSAMSKFFVYGSYALTYDTEMNIHEGHQFNFTQKFDAFEGMNIINEGYWDFTDKTKYTGDEYFDKLKEYLTDKNKNKKSLLRDTPFVNREVNGLMQMAVPTFGDVDSFSEFSTQDVIRMQDENSLGDSGANTVNMREGLQKNRFIREIVPLSDSAKHYLLLVAHLGMEFNLDPRNPSPRKLSHLKGGIKIKGAPEKFTFATHICWQNLNATPLINQGTKGPEYPKNPDDNLQGDTDLNEVTVKLLRNKNGPTGMSVQVVVSQREGVLASLTDFHYIKSRKRYGLPGNDRSYVCALLPEVALSRTTIRKKLSENPLLERAIGIVADMCQIEEYWHQFSHLMCTPEELYEDLKKLGYDWNQLLSTRSWWTFDNDKHEVKFLSTVDLLKMRLASKNKNDCYIPYWMTNPPKEALEKWKSLHGTDWKVVKRF